MLPIGHVLNDRYRIDELLGQGGMAAVYLVTHTNLKRRFALKIVAANLASQPRLLKRFRREINILSEIEHPNVVSIVDCDSYQGQFPYLVMELLRGQDLSRLIAEAGALDPARALTIFLQIANAVGAAHEHNVVHRDLKPANIFLCEKGPYPDFVKVLDFGIAKVLQRDSGLATHGSGVIGTPSYMAPEQALGQNQLIDARTDQFALASILYELLTGQSAFYRPGEPMLLTLARVVHEEPPPVADARVDAALRRAWRKDPAQRFSCLREFLEATGALDLTAAMAMQASPFASRSQETMGLVTQPISLRLTELSQSLPRFSAAGASGAKDLDPLSRLSPLVVAAMGAILVVLSTLWGLRAKPRPPRPPVVALPLGPSVNALLTAPPARPPPPAISVEPAAAPSIKLPVKPPVAARPKMLRPSSPGRRPKEVSSSGANRSVRVFGLNGEASVLTEGCVRTTWQNDLAKLDGKQLLLSFHGIPMLTVPQKWNLDDYHWQRMNKCLRTTQFPTISKLSETGAQVTVSVGE